MADELNNKVLETAFNLAERAEQYTSGNLTDVAMCHLAEEAAVQILIACGWEHCIKPEERSVSICRKV